MKLLGGGRIGSFFFIMKDHLPHPSPYMMAWPTLAGGGSIYTALVHSFKYFPKSFLVALTY